MTHVNRTGCNRLLLSALCAVQCIVLLTASTNLFAASMNLAWNANRESDLAGYRIYYGTSSGNYTSFQETGRVTSYALSNLTEGRTYYIAMTAFDTARNESRRSAEISEVAQDGGLSEQTVYEDSEDGETVGWTVYDKLPSGGRIENIYDGDRQSYVIELTGYGTNNGYRLGNTNGGDWHNESQAVIQWSVNYSESFIVYIDLETTAGHRYLTYKPVDFDLLGIGEYVFFGLGADATDGQWHTFVRDLQADLNRAQPGVVINEVNGFLIRGSGLVDDIIMLSDSTSGGDFFTAIEAEDMTYHSTGGPAGIYWNLYANGTMEEEVSLPASGTYRFEIIAKASLANATGAKMALHIDSNIIGSVFVNSTTAQTYTFTAELSAGTHEVAIGFLNDYCDKSAGIDRNLYVDKMTITYIAAEKVITVIEAEDMTYHSTGGPAGIYWNLYANGTMEEEVSLFASGTCRFEIIAKASLANNLGADMRLLIDGETRGSVFVNSTMPHPYVFNIDVQQGTHEFAIGFYNDYAQSSTGIDRNLYVDKIIIVTN